MCKAMEEIKKRERAIGFEIGFEEGYKESFKEGFEIGFKEGFEESYKESFEEGFKEGLEESRAKVIEALVETMHELDYSKESIVKQVEKRFSVTRDEAENAVERHLD